MIFDPLNEEFLLIKLFLTARNRLPISLVQNGYALLPLMLILR